MITLQINDMTCGRCASSIARAVAGVDKAARVEVDIPGKTVSIMSSAADGALIEAIREAGYTPREIQDAPAQAAAARASAGCGCGCGPGKAAPVEAARKAPAGGSCCG